MIFDLGFALQIRVYHLADRRRSVCEMFSFFHFLLDHFSSGSREDDNPSKLVEDRSDAKNMRDNPQKL